MKRLVFIVFLIPFVCCAQHSISGTLLPPGEFKMALLYKVEPTHSTYITNAPVKADGSFKLKLDSTITKGMYRITYAVPQEEYNFDVIFNAKENIALNFNSETGVEFLASQENKIVASYTNSMLMITNSIANYFKDTRKAKDTLALLTIFKTQRETQQAYEEASKALMAQHFIKANKPYIPKYAVDVNTYVEGLRAHYFDYVDFNSEVLQRSKFLTERMLNYVFGMSSGSNNEADDYKQNIKEFNNAMRDAPDAIKKFLFTNLWEQMVDLKQESVANFVAENYLMDLSVKLNDQQLLQALILHQNTSIGNKAPNFSLEVEENGQKVTKNLSELQPAETYIIAFWSSGCSHCLQEIPKLHAFSKTYTNDKLKVIAVGLEEETYAWKNLTYDFPNFLHVYGEGKWDNEIGNSYGIIATPTYFVLDKDKRIVFKPDDFNEVKEYFNTTKNTVIQKKE